MSPELHAYLDGVPVKTICRDYAISDRALRWRLRRAGLGPQRRGAATARARQTWAEHPNATAREIAALADVSFNTAVNARPTRGRR